MSAGEPARPVPGPGDAPAGRARGWRFRLRVHISTLFVVVMTAAGLAIVGYGYRATSRLLLAAGDDEFLHVAERTADHVRTLLAPARLLVELLARHRVTGAADLAARLESLPFLTTALAAHPEISAVYVGFGNGDFFLVRSLPEGTRQSLGAPPEAAFLVQSLTATDRPTPGRYIFVNAQLGVVRNEPRPSYRFDPRTRDWYQRAMSTAALVRTNPYVFFTTREVGTTLAQRATSGATVVGVDITLQELSRHLTRSRVTLSTQIALVDRLGLVIAHPDPTRLVRPGTTGDPGLTRVSDLGEPVLGRLFAEPGGPAGGHVTLSLAGEEWVGAKPSIEMAAGEPLLLLLAVPRKELVAEARGLAQWQVLIGLGVLGLALLLVWLSARYISRPLETLTRSVRRMGGGDLDTRLPEIGNPLEVGALRDVTDHMRRRLRRHIEERAARLAEEQRRARELEIARQIQQSMLPTAPPEPLGGCHAIAATLQPAREVGGDLYDFFLLDDRRLVFAIADVADKGIAAALLMARVTGLLREMGRGETGPDEILRELDTRLSQGNDMCMFVTMACAVLDGESGELRYASAGHERPVLRRLGGATTVLVLEGGPALGLGPGQPFPVWTGRLAPGDALVLCTDGVTEAFDAGGTAFGLERFRRVVAETPAHALGTLPGRLVETVERFSAGGAPRDDLALLALQYRPPGVTVDAREGESWRFTVDSEPGTAARAWRWVEVILGARDIPPPTVHDCVLAVEELVTNVVMHAYRGQPGHQAYVGLRLRPEMIEIRIEDAGPPFNPLEAPAPDLEAPLVDRRVGGLGLVLVKNLVDRWEYAREGAANVVTLHWRRPAPPAEDGSFELAPPSGTGGTPGLEIEIDSPGPAERRVALRGRLDSATAPSLESELAPLLDGPAVTSLVFRLDSLEYVSSAGIRCVIRARKVIEGRGGRVAIVGAQPPVLKVFELVKALRADQVFASQAEPDALLDAAERRGSGPR
ncbi:MAG TPA: SpoIIE family protein phosphatase [Methylomirabilota bacterium]|jgi:sigma-B regulation protein RsbU (phosphoserine phosphatase)